MLLRSRSLRGHWKPRLDFLKPEAIASSEGKFKQSPVRRHGFQLVPNEHARPMHIAATLSENARATFWSGTFFPRSR